MRGIGAVGALRGRKVLRRALVLRVKSEVRRKARRKSERRAMATKRVEESICGEMGGWTL